MTGPTGYQPGYPQNNPQHNPGGYQQAYQPGYPRGHQPEYPSGYQPGYQFGYPPGYPPAPRSRSKTWRAKVIAVISAVVITVSAGIVGLVVLVTQDPPAVKVVKSFLSALRRQDATEALRIARPTWPVSPGSDVLLKSNMLSSDWEVTSVRERPNTPGIDPNLQRQVDVKITTSSGASSTGLFLAEKNPRNGWHIPEPFATVSISNAAALAYLGVNGQKIATTVPTTLPILPGSYAVSSLQPKHIKATTKPVVIAGGGGTDGAKAQLPLSAQVSDAAYVAIDQKVRAMIDGCVKSTIAMPKNCPFSSNSWFFVTVPTHGLLYLYSDKEDNLESKLRWEMGSYPTLGRTPGFTANGSFTVTPTTNGSVYYVGTGYKPLKGPPFLTPIPFRQPCAIDANYLVRPLPTGALEVRSGSRPLNECGE